MQSDNATEPYRRRAIWLVKISPGRLAQQPCVMLVPYHTIGFGGLATNLKFTRLTQNLGQR